jgi:MoaA/NifB/PqqE/SkfB family radical SAM enzyme
MPVDTAIAAWESLKILAGDNAKVHLTGGEPFLYWDRLIEILQEGKKRNLGPADIIETNGFWATSPEITTKRLKALDELGMHRLKISTDPFHQEYVDIEPVRLLANMASDILGSDRVLVRWRKYLEAPVKMKGLSPLGDGLRQGEDLEQQYLGALRDYPCRFTGRAGGKLAESAATVPIESIKPMTCKMDFLGAKGVHIDPFGNVFNGTCSGIIIGNVNAKNLEDIWKDFSPAQNEFISTLFEQGPAGLLENTAIISYKKSKVYANKCHLCTSIRNFLFDKGLKKSIIGPKEVYGEP